MTRRIAHGARAAPWLFLLLGLGVCCAACDLIDPGAPSYYSNEALLRAVAKEAGFEVDPEVFQLTDVQLREDALVLNYRGVAHVQDFAWVCRFSAKSSEQNPRALTDLNRLVPEIRKGREGFREGEPDEERLESARLEYLPYTFDAPIRDSQGRPHRGRGILGILDRRVGGETVVYYFNLYNFGDRPSLGREDLEPILKQMLR